MNRNIIKEFIKEFEEKSDLFLIDFYKKKKLIINNYEEKYNTAIFSVKLTGQEMKLLLEALRLQEKKIENDLFRRNAFPSRFDNIRFDNIIRLENKLLTLEEKHIK